MLLRAMETRWWLSVCCGGRLVTVAVSVPWKPVNKNKFPDIVHIEGVKGTRVQLLKLKEGGESGKKR